MRRHRDEDAHGRYPGKKQRRRIASDDDEDEDEDEGKGSDDDEEEEEEEQEQENQGYGRGHRPRRAFNPFGSQLPSTCRLLSSPTDSYMSPSPELETPAKSPY